MTKTKVGHSILYNVTAPSKKVISFLPFNEAVSPGYCEIRKPPWLLSGWLYTRKDQRLTEPMLTKLFRIQKGFQIFEIFGISFLIFFGFIYCMTSAYPIDNGFAIYIVQSIITKSLPDYKDETLPVYIHYTIF